jgi:hypothetical protein
LKEDGKVVAYNISLLHNEIAQNNPVFDFIVQAKIPETVEEKEITCKFCMNNSMEEGNPLISICNCKGGIKFVHFLCLKIWMGSGLIKTEKDDVTSYYLKKYNCELCKKAYPRIL